MPRDWLAGVKRAEVETAVALPGRVSFDHAMPVVEVVISPSKASHECSRSVDASRVALRRPADRAFLVSGSELSVDEHAELLAKAAPLAWRRAAPRVQAAPQADWMDKEAWQAVRAHAVARRAHQKASRFLPRAWLKTFFAQWRHVVRLDGGAETPRTALGRGRVGQAQSADCVVPVWHGCSGEGSERRCDAIPSKLIAAGGQGHRRALGVLCAKVLKEGAPMLWKGGDMAAVPRKPGPLTPSNTRGVLCSSCPGKMYANVLRAATVPWLPLSAGMSQTGAVRGGGTEFAIMTRSLQFLGSVEKAFFRRHLRRHSEGLL